jgi:hypothetical protein
VWVIRQRENPPKVAIRLEQEVFNKNIFTKLYPLSSSKFFEGKGR